MYCPDCGKYFESSVTFCPQCGKRIGGSKETFPTAPGNTQRTLPTPPKKSKGLLIAAVVLMCFGAVSVFGGKDETAIGLGVLLLVIGVALMIIGKRKPQPLQPQSTLQRLVNDEKTEQTGDVYILNQEGHVTVHADGKPISEKEIPYLIEQGLDSARTYYDNSPNPKFHRSEQEFELSYRFECNHGTESQKKIDAFTDHAKLALEAVNIDEKIRLLEETIDLFYKARDWHYKKSKGGMIYFQDMWEHLHNSRNPDFSWVDPEKETLKSAILERDEIEPWILQHADPGFMQPEIYRAFPSVEQATLRKSIDRLVNFGGLNKEKIGRSYRITTASVASAIVDP